MAYTAIRLTHSGGVSTITLDRPPVNAVSPILLTEVLAALNELEARDETRCIVFTGAGTKAFSAGADIGPGGDRDADEAMRFRDLGRQLVDRLECHPKPVIAAIRGWAIGGGFALGMACDVRLASSKARFRTGDAYIGVVPSWGMSLARLVHYIGRNRTLDMLILGEDITAEQALAIGLVSKVIPDDQFEAEVARIAARVASGSPITFRAVKETVRAQAWESPYAAQRLETHWARIGSASDDYREGVAAFRERRTPNFKGR